MTTETTAQTKESDARVPDGPRGNLLLGNALNFRADTVRALVEGWREYGDVVRFRGPGPFFPLNLFAHPDHVQHVLQGNFANYTRPPFVRTVFKAVVGNGLVTTEGDFWKHQRRLSEPAFQRARVEVLQSNTLTISSMPMPSFSARSR